MIAKDRLVVLEMGSSTAELSSAGARQIWGELGGRSQGSTSFSSAFPQFIALPKRLVNGGTGLVRRQKAKMTTVV